MPKRTWQPSRIHRSRVHGFRRRRTTTGGRKILKNRRRQGRKRIAV